VLISVPDQEVPGVFHPVSARDDEAQARDGQAFYALDPLDSQTKEPIVKIQTKEPIVKIQFDDGIWVLATPTDLETVRGRR
jgi:hypothetical protein